MIVGIPGLGPMAALPELIALLLITLVLFVGLPVAIVVLVLRRRGSEDDSGN
ncbi:hypothetical protein [Halococcoides cellulosivorans]|uniref:hypothetical protein n=1 Tax=Halococcoides cellulosivorans TaxID=1679096 RepID=UPI00131ED1EA|nr:hypothetical protein [Halococcoides cellulosivorans]